MKKNAKKKNVVLTDKQEKIMAKALEGIAFKLGTLAEEKCPNPVVKVFLRAMIENKKAPQDVFDMVHKSKYFDKFAQAILQGYDRKPIGQAFQGFLLGYAVRLREEQDTKKGE